MGLPTGYTEVQYIQSSGTQRIDTEVIPNQDTRVVMDAEVLSLNTGSDHHLGSVYSNSQYWTLRLQSGRGGFAARYDAKPLTNLTHNGDVFARHVFDQNKNVVKVDSAVSTIFDAVTWNASLSLPIFCYRGGESSFSGYISMKLYSEMIYDNGTLIRNFIPCINPDGEAGLYDTVNSKFYGNAGTGVFLAGPRRINLPSGYAQLEYIQSSGAQYVDSDVTPNINTKISLDFNPISIGSDDTICGIVSPNLLIGYSSTAISGAFKNSTGYTVNVTTSVRTRHNASISNGMFLLDGTEHSFTGITTYSTTRKIYIFASSYSGASDGAYGKVTAKVYSCKLYDNATLIRDFIPCSNPSGAIGLYDLANSKFYANAGTGVFTAGPEVTWPSNDAIYVKVNGIWRQIDGIKLL